MNDYRLVNWIKRRVHIYKQDWLRDEPFDWRSTVAIIIGTVIFTPLLTLMPNLGWDWYFFKLGTWNPTYPPWMPIAFSPLLAWDWRMGLAILTSLLFVTTAVAAAREAKKFGRVSLLSAALFAMLTGPLFMLIWQGNVVEVTLFGLVALPFGVPFATVQPHLTSWALLARRKWTMWGIGFLILTLIAWGFWPNRYLNLSGLLAHPVAMGWQNLGLPVLIVGLAMLLFSNADPLRLIAAGTFIAPYLMPIHMLLLTPAIGRVQGWRRVLIWVAAQLPLLPVMFTTTWSKYIAMLFPLLVWWLLRPREAESADRST